MADEKLIRSWLVNTLKKKLGKDYRDIKVNGGERKHQHEGFYPDLILGNHGLTLADPFVDLLYCLGHANLPGLSGPR